MKKIILAIVLVLSSMVTGCQPSDPTAALEQSGAANADAEAESEAKSEAESEALATPENEADGTTLTIAAFLPNSYLDYVAQEYMVQHPGVTVTVNTYTGDERGEGDLSKYQQTLNTAMMSGGGEDIVDASPLNWQRLADNAMLLGLDDGLEWDSENYYMNIIDGFMYKDQRVVLPLTFSFEAYELPDESPAADETFEELTLDDLRVLTERYPGIPLTNGGANGMSAEGLALQLFWRNMDTLMNLETKTVNMNDGQFEAILTEINAILQTVNPPEESKTRFDAYTLGEPYLMGQYGVYSPAMTSNGLVDLGNLFPLTDNGQSVYASGGFLPAINANTKNAELAFDFLQFMISDAMMQSPELYACTINKTAMKENAALMYESVAAEGYAPEGFTEGSLKKNILLFDEMAVKLTIPEYTEPTVIDFLYEDFSAFFQGDVSAKEACDSLQSQLSLYLNE